MIKAFNKISSSHPDISLKVVGHCPDREPYEKLAAGNPRISFQKGVDHEEAMALVANCTVFVLPSRAEGVPRVLIEAMAARKPVLSTRVSGIPYLVEEGQSGLLVDPDDVDGLASKMDQLLKDPGLAHQLEEKGHRRAMRDFSEARYVEQFHEMLKTLVGEKRVAREASQVTQRN